MTHEIGSSRVDADNGDGDEDLTPSDQRMIRAMNTADAAKVGVIVTRTVSVIAALAILIGEYLFVFEDENAFFETAPNTQLWAQYLRDVASPLTFAGLLFGASYLLALYAARLDMDIVLADDDDAADDDESSQT